ncbi:hypothetical protein SHKM778_61550 [Streptomyces sp. KM77-8]|uniref:Hydantoinase B/oxoprolinase domain-containing protein n=1 Tax=Streptomyces haneummycinicus TaxID=3074435 RepID=A0AAT9HRR9_9ACTN
MPGVHTTAAGLEAAARAELLAEDVPEDRIEVTRRAQLRYDGTDTTLTVELTDPATMRRTFEERHRATYSFTLDRPIVVEALSVEATGLTEPPISPPSLLTKAPRRTAPPPRGPSASTPAAPGATYPPPPRGPSPGESVTGPAIITESGATTVVDDGWRAATTDDGQLVMERVAVTQSSRAVTEVDPVLLEVFNNLFMSIAEQMGARLESTAQSVNIKERLDFSCALFDPDGNLVANAPHIPVHLGSMGTSVKEVIRRRGPAMRPGDTYAVNDPYHGGTHLPDVTVITPVFAAEPADGTESDHKVLFYVASRGHHAEIGGIAPGSMPAGSHSIDEEGVLFDNWLLTENGRFREDETLRLLTEAPHPHATRRPTSPTCVPRSPPTTRVSTRSAA